MILGIIVIVLGALMLAEGISTSMGNPPFLFLENMNRGFEAIVALTTILLGGTIMAAESPRD